MNSGWKSTLALSLLGLITTASRASANTPEDIQGVGARNNAMGGAATASVNDFTAAYYNPAALSRCVDDHVGVDIRHTIYDVSVRRIGADAPPSSPKPTRDQTRITTGFCLHLPYNITFGMSLGIGLQNQMTVDAATPNSRPQWIMYGESLEQLSTAIGLAYRPIPQLAIGIGGSIIVNTDISFGATVPVAVDDDGDGYTDPASADVSLHVVPSGAPYAGIHVRPIPQLDIGVTFRGSMYVDLQVPATISARAIGGIDIPIPIQISGLAWYTPRQLAVGVAATPVRDLTLSADLTFYNWGALRNSYYPFVAVAPQEGYDDGVVGQLGYQRMGKSGWHNILVPRVGGELRLMDSRLAIRAGYSFRKSALDLPGSRTMLSNDGVTRIPNVTTLLDTNVHSLSFGAGYTFGTRVDERDAAAEEPEEPETETNFVLSQVMPYDAWGTELEPIDPRSAQRAPGSRTTTTSTPTATTVETIEPMSPDGATASTDPAATTPEATAAATPAQTTAEPTSDAGSDLIRGRSARERDPNLPGIVGTIDLFGRANLLQERTDTNKDIRYGGMIYDVGVQLTLGWY